MTKYYDGILRAQGEPSPQRPFDIERLRTKGLFRKLLARALEDPRWLLTLARLIKPNVKFFGWVYVTKDEDVRDVLERQDEFETPYGLEMAETGRTNFILGMRDGPDYRRMKSAVLSAFPVNEVETRIRPLAARHAQSIMMRATPGFDVVRDLLKIVPIRICRDYYGITIDDDEEFANWAIALSALLFSDPKGEPATRELALVAADRLKWTIDRSIAAVRDGKTAADTPMGRLVAMVMAKKLEEDDLYSIMIGMITGFAPTNLLASGNCLDVILSKKPAREAVEQAIKSNDDAMLDKAILEAMRFKPIWIGPWRYVPNDAVIAKGKWRQYTVKARTTVMPATLSAMFDPKAVERPNEFRLDRPARNYMVFGHGIHLCIGAAIAQVQIAESLRALFSKRDVRRARGRAGRLTRLGAYPDSMKLDFEPSPLSRVVQQSMVTIVCPVTPDPSPDDIRKAIAALGNPAGNKMREALKETGIIHFASLAFSGSKDGHPASDGGKDAHHLVLELSGDGSSDEVIAAFANHAGPHVEGIFKAACALSEEVLFRDYLRKHAIQISPKFGGISGLVFNGTPGHPVKRILEEAKLEEEVRQIVETTKVKDGAASVLAEVRRQLEKGGKYPWAFEPAQSQLEGPEGSRWKAFWATLTAPAVLACVVVAVALASWLTRHFLFGEASGILHDFIVWVSSVVIAGLGLVLLFGLLATPLILILRFKEKRAVPDSESISLADLKAIQDHEDWKPQNHLTAISTLKPGLLRRLALRLTFFLVSISGQKVFRPGFLNTINTIHFARWVVIPGTNKLMFLSNYSGSWGSYLEDFIAKASNGLTGVWSNTEGFPKTYLLFSKGARDGDRFKRWARRQQVPTLFWYSAYPDCNTARIRINSQVRRGIASATDNEARDWLSLFASAPRPVSEPAGRSFSFFTRAAPPNDVLETGEIQSIFFNAFGKLEKAAMLAIRIPDGLPRTRLKEWLDFVTRRTSFGDQMPVERAMMIAFGPDGLRRLGLEGDPDHDPLSTFPSAFCQGMGDPYRSRILNDVGKNGPDRWVWGSEGNPVDAVAVFYAKSEQILTAESNEFKRRMMAAGIRPVAELPLVMNKKGKRNLEHFGFVDGISQPIIRGTRRASETTAPMHLVAPGEFLFGYRDEHEFYPPTPSLRASRDQTGILPTLNEEGALPQMQGKFRDFGRNGSFIVVRQLQQHVDKFHNYCESEARKIVRQSGNAAITQDWIAAKMVGRWQDGSSLVRYPDGPSGKLPDNDFSFGVEDPQGLQCPLGAHIRRSNPRNSLGSDHETQIKIGKRHRILRVGRSYERDGAEEEKGLLFMCLNADIERQYEFIQQSWVTAGSFHGLLAETDPTFGSQNSDGRFTIPGWERVLTLQKLPNFVTTRGGGYFFMPSRSAMRYLISRL